MKFSNQLQTSSLQFGFKAKSSTNLCTFVLKETLAYYFKNQTTVFCKFLDASVLFCVYIDGLLTALASANVGCYIGRNYVGALAPGICG